MNEKWRQLRSTVVFETLYFNIRQDVCRLPNGSEIDDYYVLQSADIVLVVAQTSSKEIILVEQYRHGIGEICLELPGGACEPDSINRLADAKRELREETGYVSQTWHKLTTFINDPTRTNNRVHIYLALDAVAEGDQNLDPTEEITIHRMPQAEIMSAIRDNTINVPNSVAGLLLAIDWLVKQE